MAYELSFDEQVGDAVRRAAREQLGGAASGLAAAPPGGRGEAVHDARKRLKKSRALLRLVRSGMPASRFRAENDALRDRGRALSAARDADALVETIDRVAERAAGRVSSAALDALSTWFAQRAATERATNGSLDAHASETGVLNHRVGDWPLEECDCATLVAGLTRTYARGRRAFRRADRDPTAENLHAWRKRVKDLWYQQRLLRAAWPGVFRGQAGEARALSKILGEDHDLVVLDDALARSEASVPAVEAERDAILEVIAGRRTELLDEARALGRRVYAESPKRFRRRMRRYVTLATTEASVAQVG
jgi:CHAD domain-containing protein